ncbi:hypothetical protein CEXT_305581 [Caerostris extrusa]|uniref:LAGLIDADG homing endonuclease n=1 Tax=Caerostris extrusa TaxID=172846 RepID=A0AAV4YDF4_CAEEX|nr:hypothetical protein CEXT_305581 [Caerostris extrusa]
MIGQSGTFSRSNGFRLSVNMLHATVQRFTESGLLFCFLFRTKTKVAVKEADSECYRTFLKFKIKYSCAKLYGVNIHKTKESPSVSKTSTWIGVPNYEFDIEE